MSKRDALKGITKGFAKRGLKTGRMAASVAAAGAKRVVRTSDEDDAHFGDALLSQMDEMKGFAMKAGQILSYMDGALPPETARRLRALQKGSQPVELESLRPQVEASLGGTLDELFDRFDVTPIASASIGQVHRASLDGQEWAVKLQYPNVANTFRSDFSTLRTLSRFASLGTRMNAPDIVRELETRFLEECDYTREAAWQEAVRSRLNVPGAVIPAVRADRSTDTVLCSEFMPGEDFYAFAESASQAQRNRAAAIVFQASFGLIFKHGIINADPHPCNYLFGDDGVVLLDWGCVRAYDQDFIQTWKAMARVILNRDRGAFEEVFRRTGMVGSKKFSFDAQWEQMLYLYEPFMTAPFTYTSEYVARSYAFIHPRHNANLRHVAMPPEWVWTQRLHWGLNSVLAHLNAEADWPTLYRQALEGAWDPIRIDPA